MDEPTLHWWLAMALLVSGVAAFIRLLVGEQAPYGRYNTTTSTIKNKNKDKNNSSKGQGKQHQPSSSSSSSSSHGYGPSINARIAWFVMESPNLWVSAICLLWPGLADPNCVASRANRCLLGLFLLHYAQRALLYPILMPPTTRPMPVGICGLAWLFCTCNGYLQARFLTRLHAYPDTWLHSPQFLVGAAVFFVGFALNVHADSVLRGLARRRREQEQGQEQGNGNGGYAIPEGGLFGLVSAANYAAEMLEWAGFAVACGLHYPGLIFAAFTILNLAPRGVAHHRWYQEVFGDKYPKRRKAVIPFLY
jgi:3-oxo-5-alpha-steroid 4-dehydrogenase 1